MLQYRNFLHSWIHTPHPVQMKAAQLPIKHHLCNAPAASTASDSVESCV